MNLETDCIEWQGCKGHNGYGQRRVKYMLWPAHRYAWFQKYGSIPDGMCVLHKCDNRSCVNVDHLFLGTQGDNLRDMAAKGRSLQGERNPQSVLTAWDVVKIRKLQRLGISMKDLADQFGINVRNINRIVSRQAWRHVP